MKITCLIIDDEPIARQIVENYCSYFPEIELVATLGNAIDAKRMIQSQPIDLIFLDINMPVLDGMAFLKTIKNPPIVIFTTAYKEYALDAFDLAACDYLLKPFSLERFIIAIDKVKEKLNSKTIFQEKPDDTETFTYVKSDGKIFKIIFDELCFAEASGNYVKIFMEDSQIISALTFGNFEKLIPQTKFIRVHRSFIINKSRMSHIEGNNVFIGNIKIPIGSNYKDSFFKEIGLKKDT